MNIQRDIFPQRGAEGSSKPQFALPNIEQVAVELNERTFTAGTDFTIPAGDAGTSVTIQLPVFPISARGRTARFGDSAVTLGGAIATTLTTEVAFVADGSNDQGDVTNLTSGQYMIDYERGRIYGKRVDASTTGTAAYSYLVKKSDTSVSVTSSATQSSSASTTASGTVAAGTTTGGTTIRAANAKRYFAQCQNNGSADVYYGTGTVDSTFLKVVPNGTFTWHSQEELKVLSSSGSCNIAYTDYINA